MNFLSVTFCLLISLAFSASSLAHTDHHHSRKEANHSTIRVKAKGHVKRLINKKKLEPSWSKAKFVGSQKKKFKKRNEWVVTFENIEVNDTKKKMLYIFLNLYGDFIAANFTGK